MIYLVVRLRAMQAHLDTIEDDMAERQKSHDLTAMVGRVGTWTLDNPSQRITWSDEVYAIHERPKEAGPPTLRQALGFYHHEDRQRVSQLVEKALADGSNFEYRARIVTEGDDERTVLSRGICRFDARNNVIGLFGAFVDLTETEQDEAPDASTDGTAGSDPL
ncbi:MAG: PAS domain-containing protein [Pseudomonadota bacterium]